MTWSSGGLAQDHRSLKEKKKERVIMIDGHDIIAIQNTEEYKAW